MGDGPWAGLQPSSSITRLHMIPSYHKPSRAQCLFATLILWVVQPREACAEDAVRYKYQDYQESDGRISVQVHSALVEKNLGSLMHIRAYGIVDTITGATPTGQPERTPGGEVPMSTIEEERKAWSLDFSREFSNLKLTVGAANSRESDYVSHGWSTMAEASFNQKNTTVTAGLAVLGDDVKVFYQAPWERKETVDVLVGINQLLDPLTSVTFNVGYSHASGYLSDPYKLVEKNVEVLPGIFLTRTFAENRPDKRIKWLAVTAINRAYPDLDGAIDASYRFHRDDFGVSSHTLNLEWYQKLGERWILRPNFRLFSQSAADFYYVNINRTAINPVAIPTGKGVHYSSDYRLSELRTVNYGLKFVWTPNDTWQADLAVEKYVMSGRDGVTSGSAYPRALIVTAGLRFAF